MGLYVSHLKTLPVDVQRDLYVYLLDYGWPDGEYETIFKNHFQTIAKRASEERAVVLASHRGIHFANEVLSYHRIFDFVADEVLPAVLITKTHPSYFIETYGPHEHSIQDANKDDLCVNDVVLIALKRACSSPADFKALVESIFADLGKGLELNKFRVAKHEIRNQERQQELGLKGMGRRLGRAIMLEPNFAGIGVNLKALFGYTDETQPTNDTR